jgi:hypothetical protein
LDAKPDIFIIRSRNQIENLIYSVDKTFDEIVAAYNAAKPIFYIDSANGTIYPLSFYD